MSFATALRIVELVSLLIDDIHTLHLRGEITQEQQLELLGQLANVRSRLKTALEPFERPITDD